MGEPILLKDRLIGFFDILGFSSQLENRDISELHGIYSRFIDAANERAFLPQELLRGGRKKNFDISRFVFDSVILVSGEGQSSHSEFILATLHMMGYAFSECFPMRGVIGFGDFLDDPSRGIFLSKVWPELVRLEKEQLWSGCFLHDSAKVPALKSIYGTNEKGEFNVPPSSQSAPIIPFDVPWRDGAKMVGPQFCLNWRRILSEAELIKGLAFLNPEKKAGTTAYLTQYNTLEPDVVKLVPGMAPAVKMTTLKGIWGMTVLFEDENGVRCDPGCPWSIQVQDESGQIATASIPQIKGSTF
jgi:hypothetical protein